MFELKKGLTSWVDNRKSKHMTQPIPSPPCNFDEDALLTSDMAHVVVRDVLPPLNPKNPSETFIFERRLTGNNSKKKINR